MAKRKKTLKHILSALMLGSALVAVFWFLRRSTQPRIVAGRGNSLHQSAGEIPYSASFGSRENEAEISTRFRTGEVGIEIVSDVEAKEIKKEARDKLTAIASGGMRFIQLVKETGLKEEIVIQKPVEKIVFQATLEGLTPRRVQGLWRFFDETGQEQFFIPAPFMVDSKGERSEEVGISVDRTKDDYLITITPSLDWLNSGERVFPVTIDPSFEVPDRPVQELIDKRTVNSRTYKLGSGERVFEAHVGHIHYQDETDSQYKEIDWTLKWDEARKGWSFDTHSFKPFIPEYADDWVEFRDLFEGKDQTVKFKAQSGHVKGELVPNLEGVTEANAVLYTNAFGEGIDYIIYFTRSSLKKVVRVREGYYPDEDVYFDFEVEFPEDKKVLQGEALQEIDILANPDETENLLVGEQDQTNPDWFTHLKPFIVWDSAEERAIDTLEYQFYEEGGKTYLRKTIPQFFFSSSQGDVFTDTTATYYAGAGDGNTRELDCTPWSSCHDLSSGDNADYTGITARVGVEYLAGPIYTIWRGFLPIDTSGLPDNVTIANATLYAYAYSTSDNDNDSNAYITVVQTSQASNTTLITDDFDQCGNVNNPIEGVNPNDRTDISDLVLSTYASYSLNSTGISWVNSTGYTKLGFREGHDATDTAPDVAGFTRLEHYTSEQTGTSEDPYLSISYFTPEAYWKFDEGADNTCSGGTNDACDSTSDHDLAKTNATWTEESRCLSGKCLHFDGSGDYLSRSDDDELDFVAADDFTVSGWVRHGPISDGLTDLIFAKHESGVAGGYKVYMTSSGDLSFAIDDDGTWSSEDVVGSGTSQNSDDNKWHHFSAVKDGTTGIYIYVDGELRESDESLLASGSLANGAAVYVGIDADGSSRSWNGFIDELKVYDYARSTDEIKTDFIKGASDRGSAVVFGPDDSWLSDGLVGYWKMDEASGDRSDSSGSDHTLTDNNTVTSAAGKFARAGSFEEENSEYLSKSHQAGNSLDINGSLTLSAWINVSSTTDMCAGIIAKADDSSWQNNQYFLGLDCSGGDNLRFAVNNTVSETEIVGSTDFDSYLGEWRHAVGVFDAAAQEVRLYLDAVEDSATVSAPNSSVNTTDAPVWMGREFGSWHFDGLIDDVRVYNRALSPREIRDLYNWAPGPVGEWKFDKGSGSTAYDSSGSGNNGNLSNMESSDWVVGKMGKALDFNGSDGNVWMVDDETLSFGNSTYDTGMSIAAWVNMDDASNFPIFDKGFAWSSIEYRFSTDSPGYLQFRVYDEDVDGALGRNYNTLMTAYEDQWVHVAATYDGSSTTAGIKLYLNGVRVDDTDYNFGNSGSYQSMVNGNGTVYVGRYSTPYADGAIDDIRLYNYARTQAQIIEDMNAGHPVPGSPVGSSILHYKFDEGYGDTANDSSPQGNDGDIAGSGGSCPGAADCPTWTNSGRFNKALDFDGTNDYVEPGSLPDNITTSGDSKGTYSIWMQPDWDSGTTSTTRQMFSVTDAVTDGWALSFCGNDVYCATSGWGTAGDIVFGTVDGGSLQSSVYISSSDYSWSADDWIHLVATWDDSDSSDDNMILYYNGVKLPQSRTTASSLDVSALVRSYFYIGQGTDGPSGMFDGVLDEVKVYNFALTEDEVRTEYNRGQVVVMGAASTASDGSTASYAASRSYCIPGDTSTCNPPVAEWRFDEKTGLSAYDTSENNNTGTLSGGPTWKFQGACKKGACLEFDGTDDLVNAQSGSSIDNLHYDAFTVSTWVRNDNWGEGSGGLSGFIIQKNDVNGWRAAASATSGFSVYIDTDGTQGRSSSGTDEFTNDSLWHHLAFTYDNDSDRTIYLYIDGKEVNSYNPQTPATGIADDDSDGDLVIGNNPYGTWSFEGAIDNMRIFDYIRTPAQIAWSYNRGAPVGHWRLDECQGATVYDSGSGGNNGTITIGGSGTQDGIGTCTDGDSSNARYNGRNGRRNASLDFDGTDDYISFSSGPDISGSVGSISFWMNVHGGLSADANQYAYANSAASYFFRKAWGSNTWSFVMNNRTVSMASDFFSENEWYHVVLTWDEPNYRKIYIDGNLNEHDTTWFDSPAATLDEMGANGGGNNTFNGQIDDARVYNYALTQDQILMLYNEGAVGFR
jgi:hypothetical protein